VPSQVFTGGQGQYWVSCATVTFCIATDNGGDAAVYGTAGWSSPAVLDTISDSGPGLGGAYGVSCVAPSYCLASETNGIFATDDGQSWIQASNQQFAFGDEEDISTACSSPTFCLAVENWQSDAAGAWGYSQMFDGTSWAAPVKLSTGAVDETTAGLQGITQMASVSCPSSQLCVAVGLSGYAEVWTATGWGPLVAVEPSPSAEEGPGSVSCPSPSYCVAVDQLGDVITYNGTAWTSPDRVDTNSLESVACASVTFCVAADTKGSALLFDGTSWSAPETVSANPLRSVACPSSSFCMAIDSEGRVFTLS
jgi:hypothetical protein